VIIGITPSTRASPPPGVFDLVLNDDDSAISRTLATIERNPVAATSLAVLLRGSAQLPIDHALAAESAVYSMLQGGREATDWRATNRIGPAPASTEPAVVASRDGDTLHIVLNRPRRHNAFSRELRDALCEMLSLAVVDDTIAAVELSGNGPSFCSGGDLGEFGTFGDPASAHPTRLARSAARLTAQLGPRLRVRLHGACMGAGIELAAFAADVTAHPDALIALPEVDLGLIPGAGGTVSITRRSGRQRCAELALGGAPISAATALRWGLIDSISPTTATASRP
jgi:enoyl-CoA hydratase/carnithine racemase